MTLYHSTGSKTPLPALKIKSIGFVASFLIIALLLTALSACSPVATATPAATLPPTTVPTQIPTAVPAIPTTRVPEAAGRAGSIDGVRFWTLPNGPQDSVIPDQNWHSVGSSPEGDIYISGMDHATNSGLYRLYAAEDVVRWVGDARTASQAAHNWQADETAQKFHTRPTWLNGKMYVATADRTDIEDEYLKTRGFHWYAYDISSTVFSDLSAVEPGGVGAPHLQIVSIAPDPKNNVLYGIANAVGEIVRYDVAMGLTTQLGKPSNFKQNIYVNRFMWVDSRGTLYFSAGSVKAQWFRNEDESTFNHLFTYNPAIGFGERRDFSLTVPDAIEVGQWTRDRKHAYVMDDRGDLYRFDDDGPAWTSLGNPFPLPNSQAGWNIELSPDEKKLYMIWGDGLKQLIEYDLATNTARALTKYLAQFSSEAGYYNFVTGYDSWDNDGNFYNAVFSMYDSVNVFLMRVNPVRLKVALGLLPTLCQVSAAYDSGTREIVVSRTGGTTSTLETLYKIEGLGDHDAVVQTVYGNTSLPAGATSIALPMQQLSFSDLAIKRIRFSVMADGDNYVTADPRSVVIEAR